MPLLIDQSPVTANLPESHTLADAIAWAQTQLPEGKIITAVALDGVALEGEPLNQARPQPLGGRTLSLTTSDRKELSLSMLGKLYAMVEWLAPQHKEVAALLEKGDQSAAFEKLGHIFTAWQQIQNAFSGLAKLNNIVPSELPVRELTGDAILNEFCRQLAEMQNALQNRDFVLLADILQYEMDGATANWVSLLESTLAAVAPEAAAAS
ncbi:MAG TPA: hypothetical protein VM008_16095 [Phycisphaerae bacterium]|nr:hypothetical protein [Phycisphaerae bacterium]